MLSSVKARRSATAAERLKGRKPIPKPVPAYLPHAGSPLTINQSLYQKAQEAPRVLVEDFTLPIRSGEAWKAAAGLIVKISTPEGPQVGDLNLTGAVLPFGLNESDVHDVINLFQVTGLDEQGRYFMNPCPAQPGITSNSCASKTS